MKLLRNGAIALAFVGVMFLPHANAQAATNVEDMLKQIQTLMTQIEELQKQLTTIRGEVKDVIREGISEGMTGDDIRKIQEILASDSSIYPEAKITGYFGPLTKEALKRFQYRYELEVTGHMDSETRDLLEEYLHEGFGNTIPPGLLKAPGIMKKIEARYELRCEKHGHGMGPLCKKLKVKYSHHDDQDGNNASTTVDNVEVEIEDGTTTVSFTLDGDDYGVEVGSTNQSAVLEAVAEELDTTVLKLDPDLKTEIKKELLKAQNLVTEMEKRAKNAIDDAQDAIDAVENAIDDASGDTSDAEDILTGAQDKLDDAENAFDDEDYAEAENLAKDAEDLAKDAEDAL